MDTKIGKLIVKRNELNDELKMLRAEIKDSLEETEMYKDIFDQTVNQGSEACEVSEKDAAKHALKIALKNYEAWMKTQDE